MASDDVTKEEEFPEHICEVMVRFTVTAALGTLLNWRVNTGLSAEAACDARIDGCAEVKTIFRQQAVVVDRTFSRATSNFIM